MAFTQNQLLKLYPRKLEPWFDVQSVFLLRLLYISMKLQYGLTWNAIFMSGLVLLLPDLILTCVY